MLQVTGTATLDGTLVVSGLGDFVPEPGDTFTVVQAGAVSGTFDRVVNDGTTCGVGFTVTYGSTWVTVTATEVFTALFCDSFESAATSAWSHVQP